MLDHARSIEATKGLRVGFKWASFQLNKNEKEFHAKGEIE